MSGARATAGEGRTLPGWYKWYVVSVLGLAGAIAQVDRQIMGLLTEPVKQDLGLTDIQLSLLHGLAFVLFHSLMAFPLGWLADRWPRRVVMSLGIFLWSMATLACGLARSFAQLFAGRLGVGVGEATLVPTVQSLLPDYFDAERLPKAFAVFQTGMLIGGGGGFVIGGVILSLASAWDIAWPLVGTLEPWQVTFALAALPGPFVALLILTMREPSRRRNLALAEDGVDPDSFGRFLAERRSFLTSHLGAVALNSIMSYAVIAWAPSFFIRSFGWTASQAGIAYGVVLMTAGIAGSVLSGFLAQRWTRGGRSAAPVLVNILAFVFGVPAAIAFPLSGNPEVALACLTAFSFCVGITSTMQPTILQLGTPHSFRGRVAAFYVFATSALGAALGPVIVALFTDLVFADTQRLSDSIAVVSALAGALAIAMSLWTRREFAKL